MYRFEGQREQTNIDLSIRSGKKMNESMLDVTYSAKLITDDAKEMHLEDRTMHNIQYDYDEDECAYRQCADEWWVLDEEGDMVAAI
jgi:type IV secretory pathway component VirB8